MRLLTYSLTLSLDGYVMDSDGGIDWAAPDAEVFRYATDEVREVDVHLLGRKLYEAMLYWEDPDHTSSFDDAEHEFAALWNRLPKVVFSSTLSEVKGNARLAVGSLVEEIERLKGEPGDGVIAIGGADLATQAADLGLIDEYRVRVCPVLIGGGTPYFPHDGTKTNLELIGMRTFPSQVIALRYRVKR